LAASGQWFSGLLDAAPSMAMALLFAWFALALLREFREMWSEMNEKWRKFLEEERAARNAILARLSQETERTREVVASWDATMRRLEHILRDMGQKGGWAS